MAGIIAIIIFCVFHKWFKKLYNRKICIFCVSFWLSCLVVCVDWQLTNTYFDTWQFIKQVFEVCAYANIFYFFFKTLHT